MDEEKFARMQAITKSIEQDINAKLKARPPRKHLTNEEFVRRAYLHVINQDEPSLRHYDPGYGCAFAGINGNTCALGSFFPRDVSEQLDELATTTWNGIQKAARGGSAAAKQACEILAGIPEWLVAAVQAAHDSHDSRDEHDRQEIRAHFAQILRDLREREGG